MAERTERKGWGVEGQEDNKGTRKRAGVISLDVFMSLFWRKEMLVDLLRTVFPCLSHRMVVSKRVTGHLGL